MDTVTIIPNQDFKHERASYKKGQSYEVTEREAYYFQMAGWVGDAAESNTSVNLDVQDVNLGHSSEVK